MDKLHEFIDGGMQDESFLDSVNSIMAKGCHLDPCDIGLSIKSDRYRYGFERTQNMINILRVVFDLPVGNTSTNSFTPSSSSEPAIPNIYADYDVVNQYFPSKQPTMSPIVTISPTDAPLEFINTDPTSSPVEFSNITVFNDGGNYTVDSNSSHNDGETLIITDKTTLTLIAGGNVTAPQNIEWPAIRLSVGSTINATSGVVQGSHVSGNFDTGGTGIHLANGQSSTDTAGYGYFYDGIIVMGGDGRIGGDALIVNGFGTEAFIYGGEFIGGSGANADLSGLSVKVINSAVVHIHGGVFIGTVQVEGTSSVLLYGCFAQNDTEFTGLFADDIEANIEIDGDGEVIFLSAAGQECETLPSVAPTSYPTLSSKPTPQSVGVKHIVISSFIVSMQLLAVVHMCGYSLY